MTNTGNLRPFTGADDPRRQNGRKKGSKNMATIVRELLDEELDKKLPINDEMKLYAKNSPLTYSKTVALAMLIKAINGDVRAAIWISNYADKAPNPEGFFGKSEIVFQVVPDKNDVPRQNENLE